jgi:hypothetical protein
MRTIAIAATAWIGLSFPLGILVGHWLKGLNSGYPKPGTESRSLG